MARALVIAYTTYIHDGRVKRHAEALAERGDRVDAITIDAGVTGLINGVNVIGLSLPRYRGASRSSYVKSYIRFFRMAASKALELAREQPYDFAIVCTMPDAAILSAVPLRKKGTRLVLDVHDTMPELYRDKFPGTLGAVGARVMMLEERLSAWWADLVLAVHEPHRDRLVESGIAAEKIRVVLNSPDDRIFVAPRNVKRDPNHFTLVCHGTITHRMGLDLAIRALSRLRERIPHARLVVIGAGDYLQENRALTAQLKLEDRVIFKDLVPVEKLPQLLCMADVGLVPSRASSATHLMLPVKLLDYAMLGIPALCARLRTVDYYFGDGGVRFFRPGDVDDLAGAIEVLYNSPEIRRELAARARKIVDGINWPNQRLEFYRAIDSILPRAKVIEMKPPSERPAKSVAGA